MGCVVLCHSGFSLERRAANLQLLRFILRRVMMRVQWNEKDYCGRQAYLDIDVIADANPGDRTVAGGSAFLWPHLSDLVTGVLCHASAPDGIQEKQINHLCAIYAAEVNRKDSLCKPRIEHMQVIEGLWLGASEEPD